MEPGLLLIPGPVPLHPLVLEELAKPARPHYGAAWVKAFRESQVLMRHLWQAPGAHVFPVAGPGHAGLESLAFSFLRPKDRVIVLDNGYFGGRTEEVLKSHHIRVSAIRSEWGQGFDLARLRKALRTPAKAVAFVHNETSTGVTNALEPIVELAQAADASVLVDAVSSFAGLPLPVDRLGIDAAFSASQKCLAGPAGITPAVVSKSLWEATDPAGVDGWYLNLFTWDRYEHDWGDWHPTPTTISSNIFYAFHRSLQLAKEEGLEARFARHASAAGRLRDGLEALGFTPIAKPDLLSNTVTCMRPPKGVEAAAFVHAILDRHGIYISGGLGPLRGSTIRIGTMGTQADPVVIDAFLDAARDVVRSRVR